MLRKVREEMKKFHTVIGVMKTDMEKMSVQIAELNGKIKELERKKKEQKALLDGRNEEIKRLQDSIKQNVENVGSLAGELKKVEFKLEKQNEEMGESENMIPVSKIRLVNH